MTLIVKDRVKETSTSTGTGAFTLAGAATGFRAFSSAMTSPSDTCYYTIQGVDSAGNPTAEWECGLGTYSAANTLTRTTVYASSNANSIVTFSAGPKQVFLCATADFLGTKANLISPSFTTPTLGVASATTVNNVALTAPATGSTLTIADSKTLTVNNSVAITGTDSTVMTFPTTSCGRGFPERSTTSKQRSRDYRMC